ncbi:MAG: Preprotein translocase, SecE subunit [Parcubacteria group bacterium GW2011_GWA2_42_35]|nr:MAG: Preprotein translocase, SecE subunit [Parcubacteria group bacterium GW2011_GWA2_42_35]
MFAKLISYLKDSKNELKHVNWPTRKQTLNYTYLVIGVSLVTAAFLGAFDFVFSKLLDLFIL